MEYKYDVIIGFICRTCKAINNDSCYSVPYLVCPDIASTVIDLEILLIGPNVYVNRVEKRALSQDS